MDENGYGGAFTGAEIDDAITKVRNGTFPTKAEVTAEINTALGTVEQQLAEI